MAVLPLTGILMPASMLRCVFLCGELDGFPVRPAGALGAPRHTVCGSLVGRSASAGAEGGDAGAGGNRGGCRLLRVALLLARRHRLLALASLALLAASAWFVFAHPRPFEYRRMSWKLPRSTLDRATRFCGQPNGRTLLLDSGGLLG